MKAIVLAAGVGGRMRPLTDHIHKSLLPVGDSTILGRIVDGLLAIEVREIVVVTGHLAGQVEAFLAERYPGLPFRFVHNARYRETNNIVSLAMALDSTAIDGDIVLIECDVLFDPAVLARLTSPERGNIALVDRYRPGMDGTVVAVEHGVITQVFPPHLQTEDFDYRHKFKTVNIYRFDRDFCRQRLQPLLSCYANVIDSGCYYELVLGMLINMQRETVRAEVLGESEWAEVDDPNDLASARFTFEPEVRGRILDRAKGGHWNFKLLDFSFMRNMYFPTDAMLAAMRRALPALVHSYGSAQEVLNEKLGYLLRCRPERVQCLHGAAQLYPELPALLGECTALIPSPTFGEYSRWLPRHETYLDAVGVACGELERRAADFGVVVIVNPNNPTGTTLSTEWIHGLIAAHPSTLFVVDESFIDFTGQPSLLQRLEAAPLANALVIASLSKSLGAPGLRLGYAYTCDAELARRIGERIPIWNLGAPAEFLLELVLKFQAELATSFERTAADRCDFGERLARLRGIAEVYPSGGNFLLARLERVDAAEVVDRLLSRDGIFVKDVSAKFPAPASHLRFAVRKPVENLLLLEALERCL
jgi:histidinol-phosphate/aromatic aminotransferase/cobyric acid decarboxylase-like protein/choline kinase